MHVTTLLPTLNNDTVQLPDVYVGYKVKSYHRITRSPRHELHQNTWESSKNCARRCPMTGEAGRLLPGSECTGDKARDGGCTAISLSIRAFNMLRLILRLCTVSGDKSCSNTPRESGDGAVLR